MTCGEGNGTPLQYSCLENPMDGGAWKAAVHGVAEGWIQLRDFTFIFHFHALEKEMEAHSGVLAWRIPGTGEPGGLPSMGLHRVGHDWSDLARLQRFRFKEKTLFKRFPKEALKICYWKHRRYHLMTENPIRISAFIKKDFLAKIKFLIILPAKQSLSALSSSLRSFTLYPYVMQGLSVFKLQSQHCCMEFFILWCLNMLIFQSHKASDLSLNGLKHHAWGWVYKINPFCCGYKSYIQALRK